MTEPTKIAKTPEPATSQPLPEKDQFGRILIPHDVILNNLKAIDPASIPTGYKERYQRVEFLAHHLAYQALAENTEITVPEEDGSVGKYTVHLLNSINDGLEAKVLVPSAGNPQTDIKILFKGTSDAAGVKRDMEAQGPGSESFEANRLSFLAQLNQIVKNFKKQRGKSKLPVSFTFAGHSLGGADAQNCMAAVMDALDENKKRSLANKFSNIFSDHDDALHPSNKKNDKFHTAKADREDLGSVTKLRLFTCNAAGIPQATADRGMKLAESLSQAKQRVFLETYNLHIGGDAVQQTCAAHLLSNAPANVANTDVLKVQTGQEGLVMRGAAFAAGTASLAFAAGVCTAGVGTVAVAAIAGGAAAKATGCAHTQHVFKEQLGTPFLFERLCNATEIGRKRVQAELEYKTSLLNNPLTKAAQRLLAMITPSTVKSNSACLAHHAIDDLDEVDELSNIDNADLGMTILCSDDFQAEAADDEYKLDYSDKTIDGCEHVDLTKDLAHLTEGLNEVNFHPELDSDDPFNDAMSAGLAYRLETCPHYSKMVKERQKAFEKTTVVEPVLDHALICTNMRRMTAAG